MLSLILCIVISYLIGSIPTGYIVVKIAKGEDIRQIGSGSTGATNVKRVMGKKWFFIVMLLDAFKGALAVVLAKVFAPDITGINEVLASVFAILGHSKSIFLGFSGGKSVATGVGTIIALNPLAGLTIAAIWGVITYISKYVSLGSIIALAFSPLIMWALKAPLSYIIYCIIGAIYIIYLHRANIKRLFKGTENKVR